MSTRKDIWVVDDDEAIRFVLQRALRKRGYDVECFENVSGVREALENEMAETAAGPYTSRRAHCRS